MKDEVCPNCGYCPTCGHTHEQEKPKKPWWEEELERNPYRPKIIW